MKYFVTVNGKKYEVDVEKADEKETIEKISNPKAVDPSASVAEKSRDDVSSAEVSGNEESIQCPMPGTILSVNVKEGQAVKKGDVLFILEAMKMENEIMAGCDCVVSKIIVLNGASVKTGDILALLK